MRDKNSIVQQHTDPTTTSEVNPDQCLTIPETAKLLKIGVSTTWAMLKDGRLPKPKKYGRCTRIRYGDLFPKK